MCCRWIEQDSKWDSVLSIAEKFALLQLGVTAGSVCKRLFTPWPALCLRLFSSGCPVCNLEAFFFFDFGKITRNWDSIFHPDWRCSNIFVLPYISAASNGNGLLVWWCLICAQVAALCSCVMCMWALHDQKQYNKKSSRSRGNWENSSASPFLYRNKQPSAGFFFFFFLFSFLWRRVCWACRWSVAFMWTLLVTIRFGEVIPCGNRPAVGTFV